MKYGGFRGGAPLAREVKPRFDLRRDGHRDGRPRQLPLTTAGVQQLAASLRPNSTLAAQAAGSHRERHCAAHSRCGAADGR